MPRLRDLTGMRFGRLRPVAWVVHPTQFPARGIMRGIWKCICDCGRMTRVDSFQLTSGAVKSCGCLRREHPRAADGRFKEWSTEHGA
jgi:hypothetical protein